MAEPAIKEEELKPLNPVALHFAVGVHAYQQFSVRPPAGTTIEELENPRFWAFLVAKMQEGAELRILPLDMAYRAEALVTHNDGKNIRVKVYQFVKLIEEGESKVKPVNLNAKKNYKTVLRGQNKYCIQRLSDGDWIKEHIPTKNEADVWLEKFILGIDGDKDAIAWMETIDY